MIELETLALVAIALLAYLLIMAPIFAILWSDGERARAERDRLQEARE